MRKKFDEAEIKPDDKLSEVLNLNNFKISICKNEFSLVIWKIENKK